VDHSFLSETDCCEFVAEYVPGRSYRAGGINQLIRNFKCPPAVARTSPVREIYKRRAIATLAQWLRLAVSRPEAERTTWVPIPPSRCGADPGFDDRLSRTLGLAFEAYDVDVRSLLYQRQNTAADHAAAVRLSAEALHAVLCLDMGALLARPVRERIALFDDVLTSGKHYKCCERRLHEALPATPIHGVFLLRRVFPRRRFGAG
jgi:predicted amidophosphoribosyltransferase